jgi:recombination protein RecA
MDVRRIGQIKEGEVVVGQRVRVKVVKNKVAPPFRTAEFDMMAADGISYEGDVLDMACEAKLVTRTGAWFRYGDMQLGQGREKTRDYLKDHPELVAELREKVAAAQATGGKSAKGRPEKGDPEEDTPPEE